MTTLHEARVPPSTCPSCGYEVDAASGVFEPTAEPRPGDVSICLECGAASVFADDLTVRAPTAAESASFGLDVAQTQLAVRAARRARGAP